MKKVLWILLLAAAGYGAWAFWLKPEPIPPPSYREVAVERGPIRLVIQATGSVRPQNRVELASPVSGRLEDVRVREGESVRQGQVLAWISSTDRAALLDAARARGEEEFKRWEEVYKPTPLIAPLDGEVIARKLEPGQSVSPEKPVLVVSDRLIVAAQVDETDIARIVRGQSVELRLDAYPDQVLPGMVDHIAYEAEVVDNVTVYRIDVLPENPPDFLRSGMTASLNFIVEVRKDALLLPAEACSGGEVLRPGNPPGRVPVETGLEAEKKVEIVSGLREGDIVLIEETDLASTNKTQKGNPLLPWNRMPTRRPPRP